MKTTKQVITAFLISLLLIAFGAFPVFAAGGGGTGGGTASNADIALILSSSSVKNGDSNVLLNPTIDLHFNKNVVNISVKSNNSKCFHLVDNKGNSVSIKIIFPDDQLRQDYREHIFITPAQNLAPNAKYSLYIDKTLQAKNATSIDNAHVVAFTTGQTATTVTNPSLKDLDSDVEVYTNKLPLTGGPVLTSSAVSSKASSQPLSNNSLSIIIISILAAAVVVFTILLLVRKKVKGNHSNHP
ncbi:MAG TPA: Ig-like domain-containing protein [Ruminiclostridium sp.]|nr:Ig-like domain-containing protein [Ruminiclostridium sp.]